jgi:hypothetical protein
MRRIILVCTLLPFVVLACSGKSDGDGDDGGTGSGASTSDFVEAYCDALKPCCAERGLPSDGAQCRALLGATFASGDYALDEAAANECSAWLESRMGAEHCSGLEDDAPAACGEVFTPKGHAAPGESCDSPGDCALSPEGGVRCVGSLSAGRTCQLVIEGSEGSAPCAWTVRGGTSYSSSNLDVERVYSCDVADGLYCDDDACVRLTRPGGACIGSEECALGTYCGAAGTCISQLSVGSPCSSSDECAEGECENDVCVAAADSAYAFLCGESES